MPPSTPTIEQRFLPLAQCELRSEGDAGKGAALVGYAAVYNSRSQDLGGFVEIVAPGAFSQSLKRGVDCRCLVNHDSGKILGRTSAGTLALSNNQKGLRYELQLPDTSYARDLRESIARGDIRGSSFGFRTIEDNWREETLDGKRIFVRELIECELYDVSPVTDPAYLSSEVGLRSLDAFRKLQGTASSITNLRLRLELTAKL